MEIYKADGKTGRTYYVFDRKKNPTEAITEAARYAKNAVKDMEIIPVWVNGMDLYLQQTKGAVKMMGVVRRAKR